MDTDGADDDDDEESVKTNKRSAEKRASILSNASGGSDSRAVGSSHIDHLNRIKTLKASVNKQNEVFTKFLLTCKETAEKRSQIETAFRFCKEAFSRNGSKSNMCIGGSTEGKYN